MTHKCDYINGGFDCNLLIIKILKSQRLKIIKPISNLMLMLDLRLPHSLSVSVSHMYKLYILH